MRKHRQDIPELLEMIIMHMLEKNSENRYQSCYGALKDLEVCYKAYEEGIKPDTNYKLGQEDFSSIFQIPQKLYGRENEVKTLLNSFQRVSIGESAIEMMLVAGYSGIGKSSLVNEVHKPITEKKGYFISGKFDQYQRNIPYYAFTILFNEFCNLIISDTKEVFNSWKERIVDGIGKNGQILIEVIPKLELIIGKQPEVDKLSPEESQNRFNKVFVTFVEKIATPEHPLTMFIDDLQWADLASLNLIKTLMQTSKGNLLIIGAYRDNEVNSSHPFTLMVEELKKENARIETIILEPLSKQNLREIVVDTLNTNGNKATELSSWIFEKTKGNAFFSNQFFKSLYEEDLIPAAKKLMQQAEERGAAIPIPCDVVVAKEFSADL